MPSMPSMRGTARMGAVVAAKGVVSRNLLVGQQCRRFQMGGQVDEAKPGSRAFDFGEQRAKALLRDRTSAKP